MPKDLSVEILSERWPHGNQHIAGLIEGIVTAAPAVFPKYGLDTPLVIAHFLAMASEEAGQGLEMLENMNYSAERLREVFPTHFTPTMAERCAHNPRMIADIAYGGRMGNAAPPSNDGWNYRGAGLTQVTGRDGVAELQKVLDAHSAGFNVLQNPELICSPATTLECGVADWIACGCLEPAKRDDIHTETRRLNGGLNGLAERERQLALWKRALEI
jgi:putative chitinase